MRYFFAIVAPPVAVLSCGRPLSFALSIVLCLLGWVPGVIHAIFVVHRHYADQRTDRIIRATRDRW